MNTVLTWLGWLLLAGFCVAGLWRALARSDEPVRLAWRWVGTVAIVATLWFFSARLLGPERGGSYLMNFGPALILAAGIAAGGILLGMIWGSSIGRWVARPLAGLYDDGGRELKPAPCYSAAVAQRKQRRTARAIEEVRRQLDRFPDDFEGILLLAEIQALDLRDVPTAEITIETWLADDRRDRGQRAIARTKLADWYLQVLHDAEGARRCLQAIVKAAPDSEAAFLAEQRLAHLAFEAQAKPGPIQVSAGAGRPIAVGVPPAIPEKGPDDEVAQLERHLQEHPHDVAAREQVAILRGWSFRQPDLARVELETLVGFPQVSEREIVHWLNLLADMEVQVAADLDAARAALQRVVDRNPAGAAAEQARQRMRFLARELNRHSRPRVSRFPAARREGDAPTEP